MLASFSWIFPANCLGFLFIVMRIAFLDDVICANHIVQAVLMMSKPSDRSEFQALVLLSLMHMGLRPPPWAVWTGHLPRPGRRPPRRGRGSGPAPTAPGWPATGPRRPCH